MGPWSAPVEACIILGVDRTRLLECLAADAARLGEVAGWDLAASVPTCPDWTVGDLVRHVANGYLNVVVRRLRLPKDWPVQDLTGEQPIPALQRCYAALAEEFASRSDDDRVAGDRETVRFWIRRMAQETVIHRLDAELAAGAPVTPIRKTLPRMVSARCSGCSWTTKHTPGQRTTPVTSSTGVAVVCWCPLVRRPGGSACAPAEPR